MQIQSTRPITAANRPNGKAVVASAASPAEEPKDSLESRAFSAKTLVTKAAFSAGGAMGGTGLGVVTGLALSNVSGQPIFGQIGGAVGALGGAAAGLAASGDGVNKENLARSLGSWVGASVGSSAGMWAAQGMGAYFAQNGAAALFATNSALLGTAAGGLVGAALPFLGAEGKGAKAVKNAAAIGAGAAAGVMAGGGFQAAIQTLVSDGFEATATSSALQQLQQTLPELGQMLAPVPLLSGAVGALTILEAEQNGWGSYEADNKGLRAARNTGLGVAVGYGVGMAIGGVVQGFTGNASYLIAAPATVAATFGFTALGESTEGDDNAFHKMATTTALTGVGAAVGDAIGHGLTALTGQEVYKTIGAIAGGVNGLAAGVKASGLDDKRSLPVVTGLLSGGASGALIGAGISALSGQEVWKVAMPILGSATGALTGLALSLHGEAAAKPV